MSSPVNPAPGFQARLGLFDATMLVAGSMIGSGIFIVSADIARDVGSSGWLLAIWVMTGMMTILGALSYAELASMMPHAGGQYVFLRESYGPIWGFLYGWTAFLVIQTGFIAAVSVAFAKFLGVLVPDLGPERIIQEWETNWLIAIDVPWLSDQVKFFERPKFAINRGQIVAVGVVIVLTIVNWLGVQSGKVVQNIFTVAKIAGLALLITLGFTVAYNADILRANFEHLWDGIWTTATFRGVQRFMPVEALAALMVAGAAMVGSLFSSDAWNNITYAAGEVRNPKRTLAWSLVLGTTLVIGLYLVANLAYLAVLPIHGDLPAAEQIEAALTNPELNEQERARMKAEAVRLRGIPHARDDRVGTAVLEQASPSIGVPVMAIAIMISTFGCVNGLVLMGPRLYYAMAKDGLFFQSCGKLNRNHVPAVGLVLQALWSIVLIFSGTYSELLDYIIFAALLFYGLTVAGLFVLRRKRPDAERPYRVIGYPVVPAIYVALCAFIMLDLLIVKPKFSWPSFIIVLSGIPVFLLWRLTQPRPVAVPGDTAIMRPK